MIWKVWYSPSSSIDDCHLFSPFWRTSIPNGSFGFVFLSIWLLNSSWMRPGQRCWCRIGNGWRLHPSNDISSINSFFLSCCIFGIGIFECVACLPDDGVNKPSAEPRDFFPFHAAREVSRSTRAKGEWRYADTVAGNWLAQWKAIHRQPHNSRLTGPMSAACVQCGKESAPVEPNFLANLCRIQQNPAGFIWLLRRRAEQNSPPFVDEQFLCFLFLVEAVGTWRRWKTRRNCHVIVVILCWRVSVRSWEGRMGPDDTFSLDRPWNETCCLPCPKR